MKLTPVVGRSGVRPVGTPVVGHAGHRGHRVPHLRQVRLVDHHQAVAQVHSALVASWVGDPLRLHGDQVSIPSTFYEQLLRQYIYDDLTGKLSRAGVHNSNLMAGQNFF